MSADIVYASQSGSTVARVRPELPKPGQVVSVRGSKWAVSDVQVQSLQRSPADEGEAGLRHRVSLSSIEEDRMGEELDVIWELELGNNVQPDQGMPQTIDADRFDEPRKLAAFVDAVRWGAVTSADQKKFQAPFRSSANVEAYQLEPLRRALESSRTNLLLADDVGLGKTIEAGLVVRELLLRHRARTVLIVCPPSLSIKWKDEMIEKFGLSFEIINSERIAELRRTHGLQANPFKLFPRAIVSMDWISSPRAQRLLKDLYTETFDPNSGRKSARRYAFDILVVDEAHHLAPSAAKPKDGKSTYAVDSKRTIATRELARKCEHRLFLSATPHNGHSESFTALLEMIDDRRFARGADLNEKALAEVVVRRLKKDLPSKGFKSREVRPLAFEPTSEEEQTFEKLDRIISESANQNGTRAGSDLFSMLIKKRLLSSPWSFALTLETYNGRNQGSAPRFDPEFDFNGYYDEVMGSAQSDEEEGLLEQPESSAIRKLSTIDPLGAATQQEIDELIAWGRRHEAQADSRLEALIRAIEALTKTGDKWLNERVVVFTEYADTLNWIARMLESRGLAGTNGERLGIIQGSTDKDERELIRAKFNEDPSKEPIRILLATDAAGEGIDLQSYCNLLINYDIPFNPSRLEQRIGRIDRYGQTRNPIVHHFVPETDSTSSLLRSDLSFLDRIARKIANVEEDLGSANQVIDLDIQRNFSKRAISGVRESRNDRAVTEALAASHKINAELTKVEDEFTALKQELHASAHNTHRAVETALALSSQPRLLEVGSDRTDAQVFDVPTLTAPWENSLKDLWNKITGDRRSVTFDTDATQEDNSLVHIHLGHAFMEKSARTLRSALFQQHSQMQRVTALVVPGLDQSCVAAVSRLVLVGRGGLRLHEEVFFSGIRLRAQNLAEEKAEALFEAALDATDLVEAPQAIKDEFADAWNADGSKLFGRLENAIATRASSKQEAVTRSLEARQTKDLTRVEQIFGEFRQTLNSSLNQMNQQARADEFALFTLDSQTQLRRDRENIEARLNSINEELQRERELINARYEDVKPHFSAAAIVLAVSEQDAAAGTIFGVGKNGAL